MKYPPTKREAKAITAACRARMRCEFCGRTLRFPEAAHCMSRGAGEVTIPENLCCTGGPWECGCHRPKHHDGHEPTTKTLLAIAAARHGTTPEAIEQAVWDIRALDKGDDPTPVLEELRRGTKTTTAGPRVGNAGASNSTRQDGDAVHGESGLGSSGDPWTRF